MLGVGETDDQVLRVLEGISNLLMLIIPLLTVCHYNMLFVCHSLD